MTQPTKTTPSDSIFEQPDSTGTSQEHDFSFFEELPGQAPSEISATDHGFSFFDDELTPPQSKEPPLKPPDTGFSFDNTPSATEHAEAQPETVATKLPIMTDHCRMAFTCLKCSASELVDFPENIEFDLKTVCHSCSSSMLITLESSAKRAKQKSREIYCSKCGHALDHHPHCPSCGCFCPSYYLVVNTAEIQRKARVARSNNIKLLITNLKSSLTWSSGAHQAEGSGGNWKKSASGSQSFISSKVRKIIGACFVIILIATLSGLYSYKLRTEQRYVTSYIKTLYALHLGSETIVAAMSKTAAEWNSTRTSGTAYAPKTNSDLETRLIKIGAEIDKLMQELQQKVPRKYEQQNNRLADFNNEFIKLRTLSTAPPASYEQLTNQITSAEKTVKQKESDVKGALDEKLNKELAVAKGKFRGFKEF